MKLLERTFGLEIEFANVEKKKVNLPSGFDWSKDEVVHNTDSSRGTYSAANGGEINTPPLLLTSDTRIMLKSLYDNLIDSGAKATRELSIQPHIYIGDLELEKVKNIFYLLYYSARFIDEVCYVPDYSKFTIFTPSPTMEDYVKVKKASSFDALRSVFENSTNKGFVRHIVNISSYFKIKTVEFRPFWATTNIDEVMSCILFSYRFVDYAITHDEETFKTIESAEDFKAKLKIRYPLPKPMSPMLFYGDPLDIRESLSAKKLEPNASLVKSFMDHTDSDVSMVNPNIYNLEMKVYKQKKLRIYNNDEFNHILYLLATDKLKIKYENKVSFIQDYNSNEPRVQLACILVFSKIKKFISGGTNTEYSKNTMNACISGIEKSIEKAMPFCDSMIEMFKNVEYTLGTLNTAIDDGGCVFFQFDDFAKSRTTALLLKKNSDYKESFERKKTEYYGITENVPDNVRLTLLSRNLYLNLHKCSQVGSVTFYSNDDSKPQQITQKKKKQESIIFNEPPDDIDINDVSKLRIVKVASTTYRVAQLNYIAKVHKVSMARYCYFVMYEDYMLGGFGFDIPKNTDYDIWLLSDFATNNRVPRISKLILLCIKSKSVKRLISRGMMENINSCYTKVYTQSPVSMKYRGLFNKAEREKFFILYDTTLGESGTMDEVIEKYQQYKNKAK